MSRVVLGELNRAELVSAGHSSRPPHRAGGVGGDLGFATLIESEVACMRFLQRGAKSYSADF